MEELEREKNMSRPGVTFQDITKAAQELKGQGKTVTIENVRAILGTGSIGTINKYLRQWKETESSVGRLASKENLPEELVSLMKGLWEGMVNQSLQRFEPVEVNYQNEITELKAELEKYRSNNQRWQKMFNQWQQEKTVLANKKLTLEQALELAHKENESLHAKHDALTQQLQERQNRVDELHRLHQQTQTNLEHYRDSAREQRLLDQQQYDREKQQLQIEIKDLIEHTTIQLTKYSDLNQQHQLLSRSYSETEKNYQTSLSNLEVIKNKTAELEKTNMEYLQTSQHWQQQFKEGQKSLESKMSEFVTLQGDNKILSQQLADIKKLLQDVQNQNKLLASEKWELVQEKAQLEGQLKQMQKMVKV